MSGKRHEPWSQFGHPRGLVGPLVGWVMALENRTRNRSLVDRLPLQPGMKVLEVGFGPGVALEMLLQRLEGGEAVGVDHSRAMVRQASRRNSKEIRGGRLRLHEGTLVDLPESDAGSYDLIYAVNVFHHLQDEGEMLASVHSLLAEGGRFWLTHQPPISHDSAASQEALEEMIRSAERGPFASVEGSLIDVPPVPIAVVELRRLKIETEEAG